jgi:hypothetical protein
MTQNPESALPFPQRLCDLIPRQSNAEIAAAIQLDSRERLANEPFTDRREPTTIQTQIDGLKRAEAMQRGNLDATQREIVQITGHIARLQKLWKAGEQEPMSPRTNSAMFEVGEKLKAAEKQLEALKARAIRFETGLKNAAQNHKEFLAHRPRKGYPTNLELVQQYAERAQFERDVRAT